MTTHTTTSSTGAPMPGPRHHIVITPGVCGGKPRIAGHRIKVADVAVWHDRMGLPPSDIVEQHPGLTLADVYAALAYYHDHKAAVDADLSAGEELARQLQRGQPSLMERIAGKRPDVLGLSTRAALAYVRSGHCPAEDMEHLRIALAGRLSEIPADPDLAELHAELNAAG